MTLLFYYTLPTPQARENRIFKVFISGNLSFYVFVTTVIVEINRIDIFGGYERESMLKSVAYI